MIVGTIIVYRCDGRGCNEHISVHTADSIRRFEHWAQGMTKDFCPGCRYKIENQADILSEEESWARLFNRLWQRIHETTPRSAFRVNSNGRSHVH